MPWKELQKIREASPLIHNITNYVVMNYTANALLAVGASPVMAHAEQEVKEMTGLSRALVLNIGTLSPAWIRAMLSAGKEANKRKLPVILDPVGSGATSYRTETARMLVKTLKPTVIRGNASEIRSLLRSGVTTKGVDSVFMPESILEDAITLSKTYGSVISVSGPVDLIIDGDKVVRVSNGHPMMTKVTGIGCTATALTGAFAAINPSPLQAAVNAMAVMGVAGEMAAESSQGPGSFAQQFLDALYWMNENDLTTRVKIK